MAESVHPETLPGEQTQPYLPMFTGEFPAWPDPWEPLVAERQPFDVPTGPLPPPAQPEVVAGTYQYLKRWTFVLVVAGVWVVGAACGLGMYYWWFHSLSKTAPVFVVVVFLAVCAVGGVLTAMVTTKPLASALAVALMSAPLAATCAAAFLHGHYFCEHVSRCFIALIPY